MLKADEKTLQIAEEKAIEAANQIIEDWGEDQGARILRICHGVIGRKIADCEQIAQMRDAYTKLCEQQVVPAKPKLFVIQGGAR